MIAINNYKVNKSIDENILNKNGFRYGTYKNLSTKILFNSLYILT